MREVEILCPVHNSVEKLELPDSYIGHGAAKFEGDVPCAGEPVSWDGAASPRVPILDIEVAQASDGTLRVARLRLKSPVGPQRP